MGWQRWPHVRKLVFIVFGFASLFLSAILVQVQFSFLDHIFTLSEAPISSVGLVLGASLQPDGSPPPVLLARLTTAAELYHSGQIMGVLVSGDDGQFLTDEAAVMEKILLDLGINPYDLMVDGHGYRTYESCRRAKEVYQVEDVTLITQRFHLSRALFLCERFGIRSYGVAAPQGDGKIPIKSIVRDLLASVKAYCDIYFIRPAAHVPAVAHQIYRKNMTSTVSE